MCTRQKEAHFEALDVCKRVSRSNVSPSRARRRQRRKEERERKTNENKCKTVNDPHAITKGDCVHVRLNSSRRKRSQEYRRARKGKKQKQTFSRRPRSNSSSWAYVTNSDTPSSETSLSLPPKSYLANIAVRKSNRHGRKNRRKEREKESIQRKNMYKKIGDYDCKDEDQAVKEDLKLRYLAIDCEMVGIGPNGRIPALARVSLVDWDGDVQLDTYVRVSEEVTDFRTHISGVTIANISPNAPDAMDLSNCVALVKKMIDGKVLVGHSLKNDLKVLSIAHAWYNMRDTAKYEPYMRIDGSVKRARKLKDLAAEKLGMVIQQGDQGHSSVEDAWAAMELYKKERMKWEKVIKYKLERTNEIINQHKTQSHQ